MLPPYARAGIKLPDSHCATPLEAARRPEDALEYVPGRAWLTLLRGAKGAHGACLGRFLGSLVKREVAGLYKGDYYTNTSIYCRKQAIQT